MKKFTTILLTIIFICTLLIQTTLNVSAATYAATRVPDNAIIKTAEITENGKTGKYKYVSYYDETNKMTVDLNVVTVFFIGKNATTPNANTEGFYLITYSKEQMKYHTTIANRIMQTSGNYFFQAYAKTKEDVEKILFENVSIEELGLKSVGYTSAYQTVVYTDEVLNTNKMTTTAGDPTIQATKMIDYYKEYEFNKQNDIFFMKGNKYVILTQRGKVEEGGGGAGFEENEGYTEQAAKGKVDTCEEVNVDLDVAGLCYVVISSEVELQPTRISINIFKDIYEVLLEHGILFYGERNNYDLDMGLMVVYPKSTKNSPRINRYYFKSEEDACKFVLYGSKGAKPSHVEEGITDYGYNYIDVLYNNYQFGGYPACEIPKDEFPLERIKILLRWHEENVYEREYLLIEFNYFPRSTLFTTDKRLLVSKKLKPTYKQYFLNEENEETFKYDDFDKYTETKEYNDAMQSFQIYHNEIDKNLISNSWDFIWSSNNLYTMIKTENGILTEGIDTADPIIESLFDKNTGDKYIKNKLTDEIFKEGSEDPYTDEDGDGIWTDKNGNTINEDDLVSSLKEWQETLKDYQSELDNISIAFDKFTDIIYAATEETKPLTNLLSEVFNDLPSIYRLIIIMLILSLIIARFLTRN